MKHKDLKQGQVYLVNYAQDWDVQAPTDSQRRMLLDTQPYNVSKYSYGQKEDVDTPYGTVQVLKRGAKQSTLAGASVLVAPVKDDGTPDLGNASWASPRNIRGTWEEAGATQAAGYAARVERERERAADANASKKRAAAITARFAALGLEGVRAYSSMSWDAPVPTISAGIGAETLEAILDRLEATSW